METLLDKEIADACTNVLRTFLKQKTIPDPSHVYCSRWNSNKHVAGAYSYTSKETDHIRNWEKILAQPIVTESNGNTNVLAFAGEAAHEQYFSTIHGAFLSGIQQAELILQFFRRKNSKL